MFRAILLPFHILFMFSALLVVVLWSCCGKKWSMPAKINIFAVAMAWILLVYSLQWDIGQIIYVLTSLLLAIVVASFAQAKLAKKEKAIIGLTLPIISFAISVIAAVLVPLVTAPSLTRAFQFGILSFLACNIPTVLWLALFGIFHKGNITKREIEKMNIMDLE